MNILRLLIGASLDSYQTLRTELTDQELNELRKLAKVLAEEYGIIPVPVREATDEMQKKLSAQKKIVIHSEEILRNTPYPYQGKKFNYPPPKIGKLNNKPKGRKH